MNIMPTLENPIRIKVTGNCNRNCFFCHQEGGMNIDTMVFSEKLKEVIETLSSEFGIHSAAFTGGEPLLYDGLCDFTSKIMNCEGMKKFSITTNGTLFKGEEYWNTLKENGLYKVNISMPDILISNMSCIDSIKSDISSSNIFQNQRRIIRLMNVLGIEVKINVAVVNDELYTMSVLNQLLNLEDLNFEIVLLPNITNEETFLYSKKIIENIISVMKFELIAVRTRKYTSNSIFLYQNQEGKKINVKTTKLKNTVNKLNSVCKQCTFRDKCQEGFYGLRLEQIHGELFIRLCIHKSSAETLMPFDEFIKSPVFKELKEHWG